MNSEALLLLDDEITRRLVLTWPLLSADQRGAGFSDLTAAWADLAACEPEQATARASALLGLEVVYTDGTVDRTASAYLSRLASVKIADLGSDPAAIAAAWISKQPVERLRTWLAQHAPRLFDE